MERAATTVMAALMMSIHTAAATSPTFTQRRGHGRSASKRTATERPHAIASTSVTSGGVPESCTAPESRTPGVRPGSAVLAINDEQEDA